MTRTFHTLLRPALHRMLPALLALALGALPGRAEAQVEIKLGTLAPRGSPWDVLIREMAQKWTAGSGGRVKLRIYAGGTMGNEGDMVRKMRVGQLSAAALTTVGLHDITPEPQAVDVPMGIESYDELDYVMSKMEAELNKQIEAKGYVVLSWSDVGFVRLFSSKTFSTPKEMHDQGAKVFAWEGDPGSVEAWQKGGFNPVVLSATDIVPSLQTGMIDTVATAPLYAFTQRIHMKANKMLDLPWAVVNGATVVKKEIWDKVPADLQPKLLEIARSYGRRIQLEVRKMNDDAVKQMKDQGLTVVPVKDVPAWRAAAANANQVVRGKVVPEWVFDRVMQLRDEYRKAHASK
jgi:TRAP-type C4-dicarboxylate transport system substrate-binding protein